MTDTPQKFNINAEAWLSNAGVRDVFKALLVPGHEVRIVGGAIRNALMGEPVNDIDMATTLHPDEVMKQAEGFGLKAIPTGIDHGTITLISSGERIEVTTLRADVDTDGRRAEVKFGRDWLGDAARRDFTMNAIYCNSSGEIFDPLGGVDDLKKRRVRFIGNAQKRVREDYLRILRFIRFHGAYAKGPIDEDGMRACLSERRGLAALSRERIWAEFSKILMLNNASDTIQLMFDYGLLTQTLGGVPNLNRFKNLITIEDHLDLPTDAVRRLGALALFVSDDARRLGDKFRLSQKEAQRLCAMTATHPEISAKMELKSAQKFIYRIGWTAFKDLLLLSESASGSRTDKKYAELVKLVELIQQWTPPVFPVTGNDVLATGLEPGPQVGRILDALEDEWLSADFEPGRDVLIARLKAMHCPPGE